jgi:hypothetical protein
MNRHAFEEPAMWNMNRRRLIRNIAASAAALSNPSVFAAGTSERQIAVDVCILGAGASGLYAASRLRKLGYTVMVIEKSKRVGGHSQILRSDDGNNIFNMGVRVYPNTSFVKSFLDSYGIPLQKVDVQAGSHSYVNMQTGERSNYQEPAPITAALAMGQYKKILTDKYGYLSSEGIQLPFPVPAELLKPFGTFLDEQNIRQGYTPLTHYLQGFGVIKNLTSLYAFKNLRPLIVDSAITNSYVAPALGMHELYARIAEELGDHLALDATLTTVTRPESGPSSIVVETPAQTIRIEAKYIGVSFPPILKNFAPFDLDDREKTLFGKFRHRYYWTTAVRASGIPEDTIFFNLTGEDPVDEPLPGIYTIVPTPLPGVINVIYGSEYFLSDDDVKARIVADLERLSNRAVPHTVKVQGFELFLNHTPYGVFVDPQDIAAGFYQKLLDIQGYRNTLYLGAAFDTHDSASVWAHAEKTIQDLIVDAT